MLIVLTKNHVLIHVALIHVHIINVYSKNNATWITTNQSAYTLVSILNDFFLKKKICFQFVPVETIYFIQLGKNHLQDVIRTIVVIAQEVPVIQTQAHALKVISIFYGQKY